jgi:hypothetical protein
MKKQLLRRWQFKVLILGIGLGGVILDRLGLYGRAWTNICESITISIIFALLIFAIEAIYSLNEEIEAAREINARLNQSMENLASSTLTHSRETQIKQLIAENKGNIGKILQELHKDVKEILHPINDGFKVVNHSFSLSTYSEFWSLLIEEQTEREKRKLPPLNVIVVHRCAIQIWLDASMQSVLDLQFNFVFHGGKVSRILCGRGPKPSSDYCQVAEAMKEHRIDVFYYNLDKKEPHFRCGFLFVKENKEAIIWKDDHDGTISEAKYIASPVHEGMDFSKVWESLRDHSISFPHG